MPKATIPSTHVRNQAKMFEDIVAKTIKEMIIDVSHVDQEISTRLAKSIRDLSNHKIARHLQNVDSELCKNIPKDILEKDASGRKYLEILCLIQPTLKPDPTIVQSQERILHPTELQLENKSEEASNGPKNVARGLTSDSFNHLMKGVMDKDLLHLAESVRKDLNVNEEEVCKAFQEMDMESIMDIYGKAASLIQNKIHSGQIDVAKIQSQTMDFVDKMKDSKEFNDVLKDNPSLSMMMNSGMMMSSFKQDLD
jgi:hypothetical protein